VTTELSRLQRERDIVRDKFPPGTTLETIDGVHGWLYGFKSEFGDDYTMFVFWDGTLYKVKMVYPDPREVMDAHTSHYFENGVICLRSGIGFARLDHAFATSVSFANGWSVRAETGRFPW